MSDFISIDVETANPEVSSICQIGWAVFSNGVLAEAGSSYINPQDIFTNTWLHNISEETVQNSPTFDEFYPRLLNLIHDKVVIHHSAFDRTSINRSCSILNLPTPQCKWLDNTRIVRRHLPQFRNKGYGLKEVATHYGLGDFEHHDAKNDAIIAGLIASRIFLESQKNVSSWSEDLLLPGVSTVRAEIINEAKSINIPEHLRTFKVVVTGTMPNGWARNEVKKYLEEIGFKVTDSISKHTRYLIVGEEDVARNKGHMHSSKHRDAIELSKRGIEIKIMNFVEFMSFLESFRIN